MAKDDKKAEPKEPQKGPPTKEQVEKARKNVQPTKSYGTKDGNAPWN